MSLTKWMESRTPAPPPALAERMGPAVHAAAVGGAAPADGALAAAMTLADSILCDGSGARTGAITLLAADALLTYAFEAAAETPDTLDALAAEAMARIAAAARPR
jgi:hypothetical protein